SAVSKREYHHLEDKYIKDKDILKIFAFTFLYFIILFISVIIFLVHGYGFFEAFFEVTSAIGTVGLSSGVSSVGLEPLLKVVLCINMWLGRIEVLPLFYFIRYILGRKL
ncbi:MAG: potassium transporter TrkG, partial [Thermoplasmatota archaeon]